MPARSMSRCEMISASLGVSRKIGRKYRERCMSGPGAYLESSRAPPIHKAHAAFKHKPSSAAAGRDIARKNARNRDYKMRSFAKILSQSLRAPSDKRRPRCYAFVQTGYASARPVAQVLGGTLASTALRQTESANKNPSKAELRL